MDGPKSTTAIAVVIAGGSGTRFWPASRADRPKQYLKLFGDGSLIQKTVARLSPDFSPDQIAVCSTAKQTACIKSQLPEITRLIIEPQGKNTAACVALSALELRRAGYSPGTVMVTLPADHFIKDEAKFRSLLRRSIACASATGSLVTFGILPDSAHTGYGYIERGAPLPGQGEIYQVLRFIEKPNRETAESYLKTKAFYWNSGMFVWTLAAIEKAFKRSLPSLWASLEQGLATDTLPAIYATLPSLSIDVGILEPATNVAVIAADIGWNDVGSWNAVRSLQPPDAHGNVVLQSRVAAIESSNCLVHASPDTEVALVGVKDLIVVVDGNRVLVCHQDHDQLVRETAKHFK